MIYSCHQAFPRTGDVVLVGSKRPDTLRLGGVVAGRSTGARAAGIQDVVVDPQSVVNEVG